MKMTHRYAMVFNARVLAPALARGGLPYALSPHPAAIASTRRASWDCVVPRRLHFIWIGSRLPDRYRERIERFRDINPAYAIWLWTDHEVDPAVPDVSVQPLRYDDFYGADVLTAERRIGVRADLLRYEIVLRHGGVYSDVDAVAVRQYDGMFARPFVCFTMHPYYNICNACFGFPAGDPFLAEVVRCARTNIAVAANREIPQISGPTFFTQCLLQLLPEHVTAIDQRFTVMRSPYSYSWHTNDAGWVGPDGRPRMLAV
jgi:mannosyltransferase OCH1-like enzyme